MSSLLNRLVRETQKMFPGATITDEYYDGSEQNPVVVVVDCDGTECRRYTVTGYFDASGNMLTQVVKR